MLIEGDNFYMLVSEREHINTLFIIILDEDHRIKKSDEIKESLEKILDGKKFDKILYIHESPKAENYISFYEAIMETLKRYGKIIIDKSCHPVFSYDKEIYNTISEHISSKGGPLLVVLFYGTIHVGELVGVIDNF